MRPLILALVTVVTKSLVVPFSTTTPQRSRGVLLAGEPGEVLKADENEVLLGELIFSSRDPRVEIAQSPDAYDEAFCKFVLGKAEDSDDMEERIALKSLVDMIKGVQEALADEVREQQRLKDVPVEIGEDAVLRSKDEVLALAQSLTAPQATEAKLKVQEQKEERSEAGLSGSALVTYENLLDELKKADSPQGLASLVEANFDKCDYSFLNLATSRKASGDAQAAEIINAVNTAAASNLKKATTRLQSVLKAGTPERMFSKIIELAAIGAVDRAFLELLDANRQQAEKAGAKDAAALMKRLADRGKDELDKNYEPEKKLLRALLRTDPTDVDAREALIRRAFEPKDAIALGFDGAATQGGPDVAPPAFISACQTFIETFGNLDDLPDAQTSMSLADRVRSIADEAQQIAEDLFGESMSPREQQDAVWNDDTTSVFDLEAAEMAAESQGDRRPWQDDSYDDMLPPGFDAGGVRKIGGG